MTFISLIIGDSVASDYRTSSYNSVKLYSSCLLIGFESIFLQLIGRRLTTILPGSPGQPWLSGFVIVVSAWLILAWATYGLIADDNKCLPKAEEAL
jgi:hypothetical protein